MSDPRSSDFPLVVGIVLFDEVEVLDFAGPFEVFAVTRPVGASASHEGDAQRIFRVLTLAAPRLAPREEASADVRDIGEVRCRNGLRVVADLAIGRDEVPQLDVLVAPGGWGTRREMHNAKLIGWLRATAPSVRHVVASVCTGAFLLAEAGLLEGHAATTHWARLEQLRDRYPGVRVAGLAPGEPARPYGVRFVDEGRVVTSAGISAGIDMALHLVRRLAGAEVACQTAEQMEYRAVENDSDLHIY
jgi:transcriptional regulator GlxA family with amidase domain